MVARAEAIERALAAYKRGDFRLAFSLYKGLADDGHAESQTFVGWMLHRGLGCDRDECEAARYFERAACLGDPLGSFYFGRWLTRRGEHERAFSFYSAAAQRDHLPAMFHVGLALARGRGVVTDPTRAYAALKQAAVRGHAYALRELAIMDMRGGRGALWVPVGFAEFFVAFCWGVAVSIVNKDSDFIRA